MTYGVLGTGTVGQTLGTALIARGYDVCLGSRSSDNKAARQWAESNGDSATCGTFADAAALGDVVVNATSGSHSLAALEMAGAENIGEKVLLDIANPLDFSAGFPPSLTVANTDSLGEQIQRAFPQARVVKTLNTVSANLMVAPIGGTVFVCGDDPSAKELATLLLREFGWASEAIVDGGGISFARGTESYLLLWTRLYAKFGTGDFNIQLRGINQSP